MDDDIIEAFHENPFQNQKEKVEDNCHDIQVDFQKEIVSPRDENEVDQHPDEENHDSLNKFNNNVQQVYSLDLD